MHNTFQYSVPNELEIGLSKSMFNTICNIIHMFIYTCVTVSYQNEVCSYFDLVIERTHIIRQ